MTAPSPVAPDRELIAVREGQEFDRTAFATWVRDNVPDVPDGELIVEQFGGGQSNPTYCVRAGDREWVLRKQPAGDLLPTAHDMSREFRVIRALQDTDVPVAKAHALCTDRSVIGTDFYIMERMRGFVVRETIVPEIEAEDMRRKVSFGLMDAAATLHAVDYEAVGLANHGRPDQYVARQVARWWSQYEHSHTRDIDVVPRLRDWLMEQLPPQTESTIVHGDFRLENAMFADDGTGRVAAIFDWEISTLGDPLCDIGYCMAYWLQGEQESLQTMLIPNVTVEPGFPTKAELIAHYESLTGRKMQHLSYYQAFAFFRLACIAQGIMKRYILGQAKHPRAKLIGEATELIAQAGWNIAEHPAL